MPLSSAINTASSPALTSQITGTASTASKSPLVKNGLKRQVFLVSQLPPPMANEDGRYVCWFCPKTYTQSKHVRRHMVRHTGESPYKCRTCSLSFTRPDIRKRHSEKCKLKSKNADATLELPGASEFITTTPTSIELEKLMNDLSNKHDAVDFSNKPAPSNHIMQLMTGNANHISRSSQNEASKTHMNFFTGSSIISFNPPHVSPLLTTPFLPLSPTESASLPGQPLNCSRPRSAISSPFDSTSSTPNLSGLSITPMLSQSIHSLADKLQTYDTDDNYSQRADSFGDNTLGNQGLLTDPVSLSSLPFVVDSSITPTVGVDFTGVNPHVPLNNFDFHNNTSDALIHQPFPIQTLANFGSFMSEYSPSSNDAIFN
ncbi:hypothetical protein NADFUDRAFT_40327 [Nadsonia fulvescens var. elongata DSM 6958]|uniref:C2H2-type domain-containing protein n=1 Tax=Nadsonia fulvescens var. elongata DSM 6958 TaxID=857566 RepID=A0A1E3PQG3_9ASCO|nr:hypothetical protein NADFUDRAFT_40327 [Nadsonia fulvescens var. elongata DSM 6958]